MVQRHGHGNLQRRLPWPWRPALTGRDISTHKRLVVTSEGGATAHAHSGSRSCSREAGAPQKRKNTGHNEQRWSKGDSRARDHLVQGHA